MYSASLNISMDSLCSKKKKVADSCFLFLFNSKNTHMHPGGRETCLLQPSLPQADRCLRRLLLGVFPNWLFTPVPCRALHLALGSKPRQEDKSRALSSKASLGLAKVDITRRDGVKCRKNKTKNAWRIIGRRGPLGGLRVS